MDILFVQLSVGYYFHVAVVLNILRILPGEFPSHPFLVLHVNLSFNITSLETVDSWRPGDFIYFLVTCIHGYFTGTLNPCKVELKYAFIAVPLCTLHDNVQRRYVHSFMYSFVTEQILE